jgi:replicative DNA helicase
MTTKVNRDILQEDKMQPHNTDTENTVLATLMRYNEKFDENRDLLSPDLFYYPREKAIYKCIEGVITEGGITDINSLEFYAAKKDVGYEVTKEDFLNIVNLVSIATLGQDIQRLLEMSRRRQCWRLLQQASQRIIDLTYDFDEDVNNILSSISEVQSQSGGDDVADFNDSLNEIMDIANNNLMGRTQALMTGYDIFDKNFLLREQTFTVIAAFPAVGKSALALNIAVNVAKSGAPVGYYSLEMGKSELASRAISKEVGLPAYVIMNKPLTQNQFASLEDVKERLGGLPIYFDDRSTVSFDRVIRSIRNLVKTKGIKLAIIDYLQIFNQLTDNEEQGMSYMARACKNIAKETDIAVIALSQLKRGAEHPTLRMLRGSGQIEESADNVVLIDRPEAYPDNKVKSYDGDFKNNPIKGTAKIILAKGRGVGTGSEILAFSGEYTRFSQIQKPTESKVYEQTEDLPF